MTRQYAHAGQERSYDTIEVPPHFGWEWFEIDNTVAFIKGGMTNRYLEFGLETNENDVISIKVTPEGAFDLDGYVADSLPSAIRAAYKIMTGQ